MGGRNGGKEDKKMGEERKEKGRYDESKDRR